jgi:VanZ family protein
VKVKICISILWLLSFSYIIYNAMQTGSDSSGFSLEITALFQKVLHIIHIEVEDNILHSVIRMSGHIMQYMIFGYMSLWMIVIYQLKWYNIFRTLYVMVLDETIQFFTPGRAAEILDIVLDMLVILIAWMIFKMSKRLFV